ncbi:MAG: hypothetical protein KDK70_40050, partial [Myxococcales bacterium]|nr:hypothetical protein [Myxococcales bacterium]
MSPEPVAAYWCRIPSRPNFGDALTPWIIRRITGVHPRHRRPDEAGRTLMVTGSIIAAAGPRTTVWGSGIMNRD